MRIAICDDDPSVVDELLQNLIQIFSSFGRKIPEICTFSNGQDLIASDTVFHLVFLDVEMPYLNGIDTATRIRKKSKYTLIIILTSYPDYIDDAMRVNVFRYLFKPINKDRLLRNVKDALNAYASAVTPIAIELKNQVVRVNTSDIVMFEKSQRKVLVHTIETTYETSLSLQHYLSKLPVGVFFQTHKSYLVNLAHVNDFDHNTVHLCQNRFTAYLTRRKYMDFKHAFLLYLEGTG